MSPPLDAYFKVLFH